MRVFQGGTDAVTRVRIEFGDGDGDTWSKVGVSGNIIDASFQALVDAITYWLLKVGVARSDAARPSLRGDRRFINEPLLGKIAGGLCPHSSS